MKSKRIVLIVAIISAAAITLVLTKNKKEMTEKANVKEVEFSIPVNVARVELKNLSEPLVATGEVRGWEEVILVAESQGAIGDLSFKEGDVIRKGQIIASIDAASLNSQMSTAQSSLAKSERDVERYEKLEKAGAVSKIQLEDARIQFENAKATIAQINQQLSFTSVKSPINGVVNEVMVEESSFVMPGNNIAEIVQIDRLKIIVKVSESDLAKVREGQNVYLKTGVHPLKEIEGAVSNISVKADESRKFKVTIEVRNTDDLSLRAGMFADVFFDSITANNQNVMVIPRKALVNGLQDPSVYIVKDGKAQLRSIKTSVAINGNVIVLAGLQEGDQVITKGIINLKEGTKINILN